MTLCMIYVTYPNKESANSIIKYLIDKKLIACANLFPVKSNYFWQGSVANDDEFVSILKTKESLYEDIKNEIIKLHPYEIPCISKIRIEANKEFKDWILNQLK